MTDHFDVVVIGGGHNGLIAATSLAQKGLRVAVCEARSTVGGLAAGREFHPGYRHVGILHDSGLVRPWVIKQLALAQHGLEMQTRPSVLVPEIDGPGLTLHPKAEQNVAPLNERKPGLGDAYLRWMEGFQSWRPLFTKLMDNAPPRPSINGPMLPLAKLALGLRLLGGKQMMEILRVCPLSIDQWLQETLDDPLLRAALAMPGLHGTWMGPLSPSSATCLLIRECLVGDEIRGGPAAWVSALAKAAEKAGVVIQTDARVTAIETDPKGTANGVTVNGDQKITGDQILSCIGPKKTLLNLGVDRHIPDSLINEIQAVRVRGIVGKVHLALSAPIQWNPPSNERHSRVQVGQHPHDLERSFDEAKHRRMPETLSLDIHIPSIANPTLAPEGHEVVSILATGAATDLDVGWDNSNTEALGDTVIDILTRHDPNLASKLVAREVLTPADLEIEYGLEGGHLFHGELALDQLHAFRPTPQLSDFAPPLPGLYLGSNGMHPGFGLTGNPGALAAQRMLHDAKRSM